MAFNGDLRRMYALNSVFKPLDFVRYDENLRVFGNAAIDDYQFVNLGQAKDLLANYEKSLNLENGLGLGSIQSQDGLALETAAYGILSLAFGNRCKSYQQRSVTVGVSCEAGLTKEEFEAYYYDFDNNVALNGGKGLIDGQVTDHTSRNYEESYGICFSIGQLNIAKGFSSIAINSNCEAIAKYSLSGGYLSKVYGDHSIGFGYRVQINSPYTAAFGLNITSSGQSSILAGGGHTNTAEYAAVFGSSHTSAGARSILSGTSCKNYATNSITVGQAHVLNTGSNWSGCFGFTNTINASSPYSFLFGNSNTIGAQSCFGAGTSLVIDGEYSAAFGRGVQIHSVRSFGAGSNCTINTNARYSSVLGIGCVVDHDMSHVHGRYLKTRNQYYHAVGSYNSIANLANEKVVDRRFVVGTGSSDTDRKNGFEVLADGRAKVLTAPEEQTDVVRLKELNDTVGNIETVLNSILAIQTMLIGGNS